MIQPFRVDVSDPLAPHVEVAGVAVSDRISRVTVDVVKNEAPKVFLELHGKGTIEGEGIVHVVHPEVGDVDAVIVRWLSNIDPEELEKGMLEQFGGMGGETTTGQACLSVLKAWASGD